MNRFPEIDSGVRLGGQPTGQDLAQLREEGVRTIIDFRKPGEHPASNRELAQEQGLGYVNLPVSRDSPVAETVAELDAVLREQPGPYMLHCGTGIRAVTMYLLCRAQDEGWSPQQVHEAARERGFDLSNAPGLSDFVQRFLSRRGKG